MLNDARPPIFGTGKQSRDFTFVANVVQANELAALSKGIGGGEVFNVASGRDYTILELVKILNRLMGKKIKPVFLPVRPGDVFKTLADLTLGKRKLKFMPGIKFEEGLEISIKYFMKRWQRKQ